MSFPVSIIIPNYNYEKYVAAAIDSALALDWPDVEVIVVDDGSTDGSREIIHGYGDRIIALFQDNSGQLAACNAGFARSRGDVIIFLDSDDLLQPSVIREIAAVWRPGISKVQFQMRTIDAAGHAVGAYFPQFSVAPTPERIRAWYLATATYPTPPGSGNVYARDFLAKIFPLDNSCGTASDSICLAAAPLLGDVVTIAKPLVSYRVHGRNQGAMLELNVARFAREVTRARQRFDYAQRLAKKIGSDMPDSVIDRGLSYLQYRLASVKLMPATHPIAGDSVARVFCDVLKAAMVRQGYGYNTKLIVVLWAFLVALLPRGVARSIVQWRFAPASRPKLFKYLLRWIKIIR